ncbi:response regulator [Desulfopila sp. IMCC35008]|uniref:PAS domain-containing hybrid sensor histidine kinase/response regulator n=1 Tax=Desulfopila sp. IMCC35008 TaxID=2653858 RepID=UPI0013D6A478|nr:response regulator [Desulfopila sp. IMCC35008]
MEKTRREMQLEIDMLRNEIKVAREASEITADFVVKQFEQTEQMLHRFQSADAERQAVLDAATQLSIIATYLDGTIQLFSTGASTLLGYKPAEMINSRNILSLHLPEELDQYGRKMSGLDESNLSGMAVFDQFVKQKYSRAREWVYVKKDGSHLPVSLSVTSLYNPTGRVVGYLFAAMDMTRQKQMESELIQAKEQAEAANVSKGDFLARMSHEIRTPMNGVIGMASLLQKTPLEPKQHNYVQKLLTSANTLLRLINDILDFSKIDAGKLELEEVHFNLEEVFGNITNTVGLQAEKKGLEFLVQIAPEVPLQLISDPLRLGQVLMNLAGNAVKFTEQGEIVLSVDRVKKDENSITLRFSVRDTGIGLQQEQLDNIFEAFSQADDSITRKYGGTGLGLAICKQLTELMGGEIWVESVAGKGTKFFFTVRARMTHDTTMQRHYSPQFFQGLRALVVDDNTTAREVLSSILTSFKMTVDTVADGHAALALMEQAAEQENPYDVILLDWIMPGMNGIETARRIKAKSAFAKIPAMLMVTANGREEAFIEAGRVGLDGFLLKPVYASVMYNTLQDILGLTTASKPYTARKKDQLTALKKIRGARILLADDNSINQEVATEFLKDVGMVVTVVSHGRECLNALSCGSYDLVLMDIQMPVMDGLEATRRIRKDCRFRDLPIIAMTAHAMAGDREKCLDSGMNGHITKPINQDLLYQTLMQWVPKRHPEKIGLQHSVESTTATTEEQSFPSLPGLDLSSSLAALDNKTGLFLKILQDFRKSYTSLPAVLRDLSGAGNWSEIQVKAHTVKGVAGYIGSTSLQKTASTLEDAIANNRQQEAVPLLADFIGDLEETLDSLTKLPECKDDQQPAKAVITGDEGTTPTPQAKESLRLLIDQLHRGEVTAEEQIEKVKEHLAGTGVDGELMRISGLIDDIEYLKAAEFAENLLTHMS